MKKIFASLALLLATQVSAETFNRFGASTGVLKGSATSYQTTPAVATDIVSLWGGTCNSSSFLRGDGSCATIPGSGTVTSVGLTVPTGLSVTGSPITTSGTLGITTTLNGLLRGTGSGFATAASSNVISLWSGTCNTTTFLRGDGSCIAPPAAVTGANPTATIGLTAVNGSAGTYMRSDAAPALSQAIAPTWSNVHTFNGARTVFSNTGGARLVLEDPDAVTDEHCWMQINTAGQFRIVRTQDSTCDSLTGSANAFVLDRTGGTLSSAALTSDTISLTGETTVTGTTTSTGQIKATATGGTFASAALAVEAAAPYARWREADQAVDSRDWMFGAASGTFQFGAVSDAANGIPAEGRFLSVARTGTALTQITLGNNASNPPFGWSGTGPWSFNGSSGTSGQVLTSNGSGAAPSWTTMSATGISANPTAIIGLTPVNGAASTYMRSDAAPVLSQAIVPTWSGTHTFTFPGISNGIGGDFSESSILLNSTLPRLEFTETDASTNQKTWSFETVGGLFYGTHLNDALTSSNSWLTVAPTGTNAGISYVRFTADTIKMRSASNGGIGVFGTSSAAANLAYTSFQNNGESPMGAVGDTSAANSDMYLTAVSSGANIRLESGSGGTAYVNGTEICRANGVGCPTGAGTVFATITVSGSTCSVSASYDSLGVASCTYNSAGNYNVNLSVGTSTGPVCTVTAFDSPIRIMTVSGVDADSARVNGYSTAGAATDGSFSITCMGN